MLHVKTLIVIFATISTLMCRTLAAPPIEATNISNTNDTQLLHPHIITIERLESLLRRAGEIFRPVLVPILHAEGNEKLQQQSQSIPYQELQPPTAQPYNFYLPPFEQTEEYSAKLDEKSRNMEKFTPPPPPSNEGVRTNYYAEKPKKLPKKFNATEKLINIKWLNAFEREALADANGQLPKAVYLNNEERNRINFDDSFFAVDMHVRTPADNNPHKDTKITNGPDNEQEFVNQNEDGEDLVAAPAAHLAHISSFDFETQKRV